MTDKTLPPFRFARPALLREVPRRGHVVIEAAAGTGKTYTLEHLIVELLLRGASLSEILTVTFTEKATREMRTRVRSMLESIAFPSADDPRLSPRDDEFWTISAADHAHIREALTQFERAPISTIHGFCQRVLTEQAFRSGRPFEQTLVDPSRTFRRAFRDEMREVLGSHSDLQRVMLQALQSSSVDRLEAQLFPWFSERGVAMPTVNRSDFDGSLLALSALSWKDIECEVRNQIGRADLQSILLTELQSLLQIAQRHEKNGQLLHALLELDAWRKKELSQQQNVQDWVLARLEAISSDSPTLEPLSTHLHIALRNTTSTFGLLVTEFLPRVRARLDDQKRSRGELDFDDMLVTLHAAIHAADGDALIQSLRKQYRFALVDEFQDTDEIQWAMFRRLFVENTSSQQLFVIGDPKQGIYGFRNADVHVYSDACRTLSTESPPLRLTHNFRSTQRVIDAYNAVFHSPSPTPAAFFQGEVRYDIPVACGSVHRRAIRNNTDAPALTLWSVHGPEKPSLAGVRRTLGRAIAEECKSLVEGPGQLIVSDEHRSRAVSYSDIFILTRNIREADAITPALRDLNIPYVLFRQEGIFRGNEALIVLDLLRALAEPDNRSACMRAFSTPFFGMSLADLRATESQSHLYRTLHRLREHIEEHDPNSVLERVLHETGLAKRLYLTPEGEIALSAYRQILETLLREAGRSRNIDELVGMLEDFIRGDRSPSSGSSHHFATDKSAVQILTMHKSKGLEAEIVFLAGGFSRGGRERGTAPQICHSVAGREAWLSPLPTEVTSRVECETKGEDERLLYVALTRAKSALYLPYFGKTPSAASVEGTPYGPTRGPHRSLDARIEELVENGFIDGDKVVWSSLETAPEIAAKPSSVISREQLDAAAKTADSLASIVTFAELTQNRRSRVMTSYTRLASAKVDDAVTLLTNAAVDLGASPASEDDLPRGAEFGVFIHEVLERADFAKWKDSSGEPALVEDMLRKHDLSPILLPQVLGMTGRTLTSPLCEEGLVLPDGFAALEAIGRERSFLFPLPESHHGQGSSPFEMVRGAVRGVVDMLFEHDGRLFIVDWKSDALDRYDAVSLRELVDERYRAQVRIYSLAALHMLSPPKPGSWDEDVLSRFGGVLYVFLRSHRRDGEGVCVVRPSLSEVLSWHEELRSSETPWGYRLNVDS